MFQIKKLKYSTISAIAEVAEVALCALPTSGFRCEPNLVCRCTVQINPFYVVTTIFLEMPLSDWHYLIEIINRT